MPRKRLQFFAVVFFVALCDRVSKTVISETLAPGSSVEVAPFFDIVHYRNSGIAFGMLRDLEGATRAALYVGALLAAFVSAFLFLRHGDKRGIFIGFILGGAIGNSIDRFASGYVTDFLEFHWFGSETLRWPAFNAADMFITVGTAAFMVNLLVKRRHNVHGNS
ncbi:MAG: signal peptidase II [Candidatus Mycalebacterium zealandia]|nr:MAG: signal peptidase II [Candidatus Mycalebacterium zealandia]